MASVPCPDCDSTGWIITSERHPRLGNAKPCLRADCIEGGGYVDDDEIPEPQPKPFQAPPVDVQSDLTPQQEAMIRAHYFGGYVP